MNGSIENIKIQNDKKKKKACDWRAAIHVSLNLTRLSNLLVALSIFFFGGTRDVNPNNNLMESEMQWTLLWQCTRTSPHFTWKVAREWGLGGGGASKMNRSHPLCMLNVVMCLVPIIVCCLHPFVCNMAAIGAGVLVKFLISLAIAFDIEMKKKKIYEYLYVYINFDRVSRDNETRKLVRKLKYRRK